MRHSEANSERKLERGGAVPSVTSDHADDAVRRLVQQLPEEMLSMAWRSELNERLRACARERTRARALNWAWLWTGFAGALACAWAMWAFGGHRMSQPEPTESLEAALVAAWRESASTITLQAAGPSLERTSASEDSALYRHSDLDVESL
jgi:hypothetical protein